VTSEVIAAVTLKRTETRKSSFEVAPTTNIIYTFIHQYTW